MNEYDVLMRLGIYSEHAKVNIQTSERELLDMVMAAINQAHDQWERGIREWIK